MAKIATPQAKSVVRKITESKPNQARQTASARPNHSSVKSEIEKLAYQFYVERGYADGYHDQDWLRAEAIILSRSRS